MISNVHETFTKTGHAQKHKTSLHRAQIVCVGQIVLHCHKATEQEVNKLKKKRPLHTLKIKDPVLNDWVKEEIEFRNMEK